MAKGKEFLQRVASCKTQRDIEGLMSLHHEDAAAVGFVAALEDKKSIRTHYMQGFATNIQVLEASVDYFAESSDIIIYKGTMKTDSGLIKPNEAFSLRDGKIYRHIAFTLPPDATKTWAFAGVASTTSGGTGMVTPGENFYQDHIGYLARGEIDGLLKGHYHDDVEMVTFEFTLKGKEAIRNYLQEWSQIVGKILGMSTDHYTGSRDVIMFKASIATEKFGTIKADDAFYLKKGKIYRYIALTIPPDKTKEWALKGMLSR